jgi:hypothetical protein
MIDKCKECLFYEGIKRAFTKGFGRCHRFPPTPNKTTYVKAEDYCGEFEHKIGREDTNKEGY